MDLFDEVDDLVMYGSQISWEITNTIHLVTACTLVLPCHGYCITENTKYSMSKRDRTNEYWGSNHHYGWNILTHDVLKNFPKTKKDGRRF